MKTTKKAERRARHPVNPRMCSTVPAVAPTPHKGVLVMCNHCDTVREYALTHTIPAKDWLVTELTDRGPGHYYRYQVTGENLNYPSDHSERKFSWSVRDIDDQRYDLTLVEVVRP